MIWKSWRYVKLRLCSPCWRKIVSSNWYVIAKSAFDDSAGSCRLVTNKQSSWNTELSWRSKNSFSVDQINNTKDLIWSNVWCDDVLTLRLNECQVGSSPSRCCVRVSSQKNVTQIRHERTYCLHRKYTNVDRKPLKNLRGPRTFQEPLGGFPEVFKCCPFQKDNIWKPKTSQKPFEDLVDTFKFQNTIPSAYK